MASSHESISEKVRHLADQLPTNSTWDDVMYQVALRCSIERGLAQSETGQTIPYEEILKEFGFTE